MTQPITKDRTAHLLVLIAALFVAAAFGMWGTTRGVAALVGAVLSVLNWITLRWLSGRIVDSSSGASKGGASLLIVGKMGLLMAIVYILIRRVQLDPIGLAFGLGVLFIGPVITSLVGVGRSQSLSPSTHPSAEVPAREER